MPPGRGLLAAWVRLAEAKCGVGGVTYSSQARALCPACPLSASPDCTAATDSLVDTPEKV